jgi:ATP-binding cassette subfamily B protein
MQKKTFLLFWQTAMHYPVRTWMAIIGSMVTAIVGNFFGPFIIAQLLVQLQADTLTLDSATPYLIAYVLVQIYGQILGGRMNLYFTWTMEAAGQRDLYHKIFDVLTNQSLAFHANRFGGSLVSQTSKLVGSFERFWDTLIWQLLPSIASIFAAATILAFVFWQYSVILIVISLAFMVAVYFGSRKMKVTAREEAQAMTATNGYVADTVTNVNTVKAHGTEDYEMSKFYERTATYRDTSLGNMRAFLKVSTVYSSLITILYIVALITAVWASQYDLISIASVYLAITYTFTVGRQLWEMNSIMRSYHRIMGDAHDMVEILNLENTIKDTSTHDLLVRTGELAIDGLTFTHDGIKKPLFDNFNLDIPAGQHVGLVGHSGSGKTTLTRLLLRFSDVEKGTITIDGQDISKITQKSLRESIAYVPQEPMLFHRTLRENIAYGKPTATMKEITHAAKQAHALEFIKSLPNGFETLVGERGVKLSGGQRQRVAIARAILKDAPILVLDEATSALDSESEKLIQDALTTLMKGRTSIVVAHRLSTIAKLDRIVVLADGRIVEQGAHAELLKKKGGTYARLWSHQSGGFIEE